MTDPFTSTARAAVVRFLPPVRLTLIALLLLGGYGVYHFAGMGSGPEGLGSLLLLPLVAAVADLAFQAVRFTRIRPPETALVTGLFLALILPPTANLVAAGATAFGAVALRHTLRVRGRPLFNPAVSGLLLGGALFGLAPAWWVAVTPLEELLVVGLGVALLARSIGSWRIPVVFFGAYAGLVILQHAVLGTTLTPELLFLSAVDPSVVFFGLFMVTEPRTAPSDPAAQPMYATVAALSGVFLVLVVPNAAVLFGLLFANALSAVIRLRTARTDVGATSSRGVRSRAPAKSTGAVSTRWSLARRSGSLLLALVVLAATAGALYTPSAGNPVLAGRGSSSSGGSGSSGATYANCQADNPSISSSTLAQLHSTLGPSVVLSYDANSAVTVFYDPVNHVTVTETDLYEDYGYAEFNGDDYAVNGCSP